MSAAARRARDGRRHHRADDLIEALLYAPQAKVAEGGAESVGEGAVAQQAEGNRRVSAQQQLDATGGLGHVHLVAP